MVPGDRTPAGGDPANPANPANPAGPANPARSHRRRRPRPRGGGLLAAFDRLRPQGSLRWCFDDAMRRLEHPDHESSAGALPWPGLPDDLWERGRSARIGHRFAGDVATVLADILAADARAAADAAVSSLSGDRFEAAFHALRYLAARVEALEARIDPTDW